MVSKAFFFFFTDGVGFSLWVYLGLFKSKVSILYLRLSKADWLCIYFPGEVDYLHRHRRCFFLNTTKAEGSILAPSNNLSYFIILPIREFIIISNLNPPCCNFNPGPFVLSPVDMENSLIPGQMN